LTSVLVVFAGGVYTSANLLSRYGVTQLSGVGIDAKSLGLCGAEGPNLPI
jgi:hypothetical protein